MAERVLACGLRALRRGHSALIRAQMRRTHYTSKAKRHGLAHREGRTRSLQIVVHGATVHLL